MKSINELNSLLDESIKNGMLYTPGTPQRKEHEYQSIFYRECKLLLISMDEDRLKKEVDKVKKLLNKYQEAKKEAEKNTSSAKVKAALNEVNARFKPDQLRKQERILMFIFQN